MRQESVPLLVQLITSTLLNAKPLFYDADILSVGPLRTNFSEIWIEIWSFVFKKINVAHEVAAIWYRS